MDQSAEKVTAGEAALAREDPSHKSLCPASATLSVDSDQIEDRYTSAH